jgi:hypothetical protein
VQTPRTACGICANVIDFVIVDHIRIRAVGECLTVVEIELSLGIVDDGFNVALPELIDRRSASPR